MDPRCLFCACLTLLSTVGCSVIREEAAYPPIKTEIASPEGEASGLPSVVPPTGVAADQLFYVTSDLSQPIHEHIRSVTIEHPEKQVINSEASQGQTGHEVIESDEVENNDGTRIQASALTGFIMSLVGGGIFTPIGWIGLALSIIGLIKIRKSPEIYRGQGFAVAGIIYFGFTILLLVALSFILYNSWSTFFPVP